MPEESNEFPRRRGRVYLANVVAATLVAVLFQACGQGSRPVELSNAENAALSGDFEKADALLESLRFRPGIEAPMAEAQARIDAYRRIHERVEGELLAVVREHGVRAIVVARERAHAAEAKGEDLVATIWRRRMSTIPDLAKSMEASEPAWQAPNVPQDSTEIALVAEGSFRAQDIDELAKAGRYREAVDLVRRLMVSQGSDATRYRDRLWALEEEGKKDIEGVVAKSEELRVKDGGEAALAFLAREAQRFPQFGPLGGVEQARRSLLKSLGRANEIAWGPGMAPGVREPLKFDRHEGKAPTASDDGPKPRNSLMGDTGTDAGTNAGDESDGPGDSGSRYRARRSLDRTATQAFDARDYRRAAEDLREAVRLSEGLEVERVFAARATEAEVLAESCTALASAITANPKRFARVDLGNGTIAKLQGFEDGRLVAEVRGVVENVALKAIPDRAFAELLALASETPLARIGAATLFARAFDVERAEAILAKVIADEPRAKPRVDQVLAALRKEDPGESGYVLEGKRFVSARAVELRELAKAHEAKLRSLWAAKTDSEREDRLRSLADGGDDLRAICVDALRDKRATLAAKFEKSKVGKALTTLLHDREALEVRRASALELIFDTDKYFYPYKDREGEYRVVQMEVSRRCALVREAWQVDKHRVTVGSSMQQELELYRWIAKKLVPLAGEVVPSDDPWLWSLAAGDITTIRDVARDQSERDFLDASSAILAANTKTYDEMRKSGTASTEEVDLMVRTNAYRIEMGRLPLRIDARLVIAARGHCEEMTRLGYFAHESPVPERKTPSHRMRLAGYRGGSGENLAINNSPAGAIEGWQHSSGHHRNMLATSHKDLGGGIDGRNFNQNFGSGG